MANSHVNSYTFRTGMVLSIEEKIEFRPQISGYAWGDEAETFRNRIIKFENVLGSIYEGVKYDEPERIKLLWQQMFSEVNGDIIVSGALYSFDGIPKRINGRLDINNAPGMTSLHDIENHFEYINERLILPNSIKSDILGVLKIKGLQGISFRDEFSVTEDKVLSIHKVEKIVNKHLSKDKDIVECQEELIDNGFKDFANL